jgi:hypothetical protein
MRDSDIDLEYEKTRIMEIGTLAHKLGKTEIVNVMNHYFELIEKMQRNDRPVWLST